MDRRLLRENESVGRSFYLTTWRGWAHLREHAGPPVSCQLSLNLCSLPTNSIIILSISPRLHCDRLLTLRYHKTTVFPASTMTHEDPYLRLGLDHDASQDEIKQAYRSLAMSLHPDRLTTRGASADEIAEATVKFSLVTGAYTLLSDLEKKKAYDHVYKYGGYDEIVSRPAPSFSSTTGRRPSKKQNSKGVGYVINDPIAFIMSKGKVRSTSIAGVQLPSKFKLVSPENSFKVAFSNAQIEESPSGTMTYSSKTTQFVAGRRSSTSETIKVHKDGSREIVIEGDDFVERRVSTPPKRKRRPSIEAVEMGTGLAAGESRLPWYMNTWKSLRENLTTCHNPCSAISVQ